MPTRREQARAAEAGASIDLAQLLGSSCAPEGRSAIVSSKAAAAQLTATAALTACDADRAHQKHREWQQNESFKQVRCARTHPRPNALGNLVSRDPPSL
jgi:hypothetical protein